MIYQQAQQLKIRLQAELNRIDRTEQQKSSKQSAILEAEKKLREAEELIVTGKCSNSTPQMCPTYKYKVEMTVFKVKSVQGKTVLCQRIN